MVIHPSASRIYIQCANDSKIHSLETSSGIIIQSLGGTENLSVHDKNMQTQLAISACGSIIFSTINNEITVWNHFSETKLNTIKLTAQPVNLIEIDKNTFISSISIHPKANHLLCCTMYGGSDLKISMFLFNNKSDSITNEVISVHANEFIENTQENERAAVDRWRKIRQEIFADDQNIETFDNILERIDDLFHMAIKSPNHTDDYKENMLRCKDENVKFLLSDRQIAPHDSGMITNRSSIGDKDNDANRNDGNANVVGDAGNDDSASDNCKVDSCSKHEQSAVYAFENHSNESDSRANKQAIENSSASDSNDTFIVESKQQLSSGSNSSGTYNIENDKEKVKERQQRNMFIKQ